MPKIGPAYRIDLVQDTLGEDNSLAPVVSDAHEDRVDELEFGCVREIPCEPRADFSISLLGNYSVPLGSERHT